MMIAAVTWIMDAQLPKRNLRKSITMRRRFWGVALTDNSRLSSFLELGVDLLGSLLLIGSGILALLLTSGQFFVEEFQRSDDFLRDALATFTLAVCGFVLRHIGLMGVRREVQLDFQRGEVRIGFLGQEGNFCAKSQNQLSEIVSA